MVFRLRCCESPVVECGGRGVWGGTGDGEWGGVLGRGAEGDGHTYGNSRSWCRNFWVPNEPWPVTLAQQQNMVSGCPPNARRFRAWGGWLCCNDRGVTGTHTQNRKRLTRCSFVAGPTHYPPEDRVCDYPRDVCNMCQPTNRRPHPPYGGGVS